MCYPDRATDTHPHHLDRTYGTVYEQTFLQEQNLKDKEYTVVSIWEHEFDSQVKNQEELQLYTRIRLSRSIESQGHLVRRPHQCHSFVLYRGIYALCKCLFSVSLCSKVQAVSCGAPFNPHREFWRPKSLFRIDQMSRFISTWSLSSSFTLPTRGKLLFPYVGLVPNNDILWNLSIDFNTPIPNTVILEPGEHGTTGSAGYGILTVFTRSGISLSLATPCLKPTLTPF